MSYMDPTVIQPKMTPHDKIAASPTNAPTNLSLVTSTVAVLAGEINSINTRYNDLATKMNTLCTYLQNQGIEKSV